MLEAAIDFLIKKYAVDQRSRRISLGYESGRFDRGDFACCDPANYCPQNQALIRPIVRNRLPNVCAALRGPHGANAITHIRSWSARYAQREFSNWKMFESASGLNCLDWLFQFGTKPRVCELGWLLRGTHMQAKEPKDRPEPTSPPCFKCGAQPAYSTSIQDQPTGRKFHMFICDCGNRSWVSERM